ncbi:permease [Actinomycetaceae bacterium TAE3-ERU4]|nr:permease [Actinomycetaceae bacterium TAE3-ERU4]
MKQVNLLRSCFIWILIPLCLLLGAQVFFGPALSAKGYFQAWQAILVSIVLQALPFLILGALLSALISAFLPQSVFERLRPKKKFMEIPVAAVGGMALPACECASVPIAGSLMRRGVTPAAALTFLLAAPAINPVVLVATAVAFSSNPKMVWARFLASLLAALIVGWVWLSWGKSNNPKIERIRLNLSANKPADKFRETFIHDFLQAGGFLVFGAMIAAFLKVSLSQSFFQYLETYPFLTVGLMAVLAIIMSLCSEADAFVAASFTTLSPTAQLVFLVVGPMVDIKLFAMQSGAFGTRFAVRFLALTLLVCLIIATLVGSFMFA